VKEDAAWRISCRLFADVTATFFVTKDMRNLIRSDAAAFRVPIAIPGCKVVGVFLATIARLKQMVACFRRSFRFGGAGRKHKLCKILFDGSLKSWPDASATKRRSRTLQAKVHSVTPSCLQLKLDGGDPERAKYPRVYFSPRK